MQSFSIAFELMFRDETDMTKVGLQVAAPNAGDDGEAVPKSEQKVAKSSGPFERLAQGKRVLTQGFQHGNPVKQDRPEMPSDAGWYVAVVRCNCENAIANSIREDFHRQNLWFEHWVPVRKVAVIDKRSHKRRMKEKVLLNTFIFCHVGARRLDAIRFRPDVYKMLTMPGQRRIYRISDKEFNDYRRLVENPGLPVTPCSGPLRKGQKVRVTEGQMAGLEAFVQRISGKKVTIGNEIQFICGATIEIDRGFLETIE